MVRALTKCIHVYKCCTGPRGVYSVDHYVFSRIFYLLLRIQHHCSTIDSWGSILPFIC